MFVQDGDEDDGVYTTDRNEFSRTQKPPRKQVKRCVFYSNVLCVTTVFTNTWTISSSHGSSVALPFFNNIIMLGVPEQELGVIPLRLTIWTFLYLLRNQHKFILQREAWDKASQ